MDDRDRKRSTDPAVGVVNGNELEMPKFAMSRGDSEPFQPQPGTFMPDDGSPAAVRARIEREIEYLADQLAKLQAQMPTEEEVIYNRNRMRAEENAAWAWRQLRTHLPWITAVGSIVGTGLYWLMTHTIKIGPSS